MVIDRYQILDELQSGAWGVLWRACDPVMERFVALRVIHRRCFYPAVRHRLKIGNAARLTHPGIVRVHTSFEHGPNLCVVEEVPVGAPLKIVRSRPLAEALKIFLPICQAVGYAHRVGVVHRHLHPGCIDDQSFKVDGFATAYALARGVTQAPARVLEWAAYFSPEAVRGQPLDARSDIYSLGVLLHHLLTGRPPFTAPSLETLLKMQLTYPPPPLEQLGRCLCKSPADRFQTVDELLAHLGAKLEADPDAAIAYQLTARSEWQDLFPQNRGLGALQEAARLDPYDASTECNLGNVKAKKQPGEAAEHYLKAQTLCPYNFKAYFNLGVLMYGSGDLAGAARQFRKVRALAPDFWPVRLLLGNALFRMHRLEDAQKEWEIGLAVAPGDRDLLSNLATLHYQVGRLEQAVAMWQKSLARHWDPIAAYNARIVLIGSGQLEAAETLRLQGVGVGAAPHVGSGAVELYLRDRGDLI